jgi:hypothetical protein
MAWHIIHHPPLGVIETLYSGELTPDELYAAAQAALALGQEHSVLRFLGDCTGLQGGHSVIDLYGVLELLQAAGFAPPMREALLMPATPDAAMSEEVAFWQNACLNRGVEVRIFHERAAALDWLAR